MSFDNKKVEQVIGRNKAWEQAAKDTDKDGVNDAIDCQPYNPNKQGVIHNLAARFGQGRVKQWGEEGQKDEESRRETRTEVREVKREERKKHDIELTKYREEQRARRKKEYIRSGGFAGQLSQVVRSASSAPKQQSTTKRRKKKKKSKGKSSVKSRVKPKTYKTDFTSGGSWI